MNMPLKHSLLVAVAILAGTTLVKPVSATTCDPTTATDPSCGLKTAIEAKYGEGYCEDLYNWEDVGGATLEVFQRYTNASIDENGMGSFTIELFPTFLDTNCTVKTPYSTPDADANHNYYAGISLASTSDITTTPGAEEIQVNLEPNQFEYTLTGLDFTEYQNRFDLNYYDITGTDQYVGTDQNDYFAPAWPNLTSLTMAADGTFSWGYAAGPADGDTRADIVLFEMIDDGLQFATFTSQYAPNDSWEYYDWYNLSDGTYLLIGSETKKSYYDDVYDGINMDTSGQVNHNMWSEKTYKVVTIKKHVVTSVKNLNDLTEETSSSLDTCVVNADDGEDCNVDGSPEKTTISKASSDKITWQAVDAATYYKVVITNLKGKTLVEYDSVSSTSKKIKSSDKTKLKGNNKNYAKVYACNDFGCSKATSKKF